MATRESNRDGKIRHDVSGPHEQIASIEGKKLGEPLEHKLKEVGGYLKKRLNKRSEGLVELLRGGLAGFERPLEVLSEVFEGMKGFGDEKNLLRFTEDIAGNFLPVLGLKTRRAGITQYTLPLRALRGYSEKVPEEYRPMFWCNMGLPLMRVFRDSPGDYASALELIGSVPEGKYSDWTKKAIYGGEPGGGVYRLLDAIPDMKKPVGVVEQLAMLLETISNPKRQAFMEENGPELFIALGKLPFATRNTGFHALISADGTFGGAGLPRWEFLRLHGAEILGRGDVVSNPQPKRIRDVCNVMFRDFTAGKGRLHSGFKHGPSVICEPEQIQPEDFEKIKAEVLDGGGFIDLIVHPNTAGMWVDDSGKNFIGGMTRNTGRTVMDYEVYRRHLNDLLRSGHRLKVVLSDVRLVDRTRQWVDEINPENTVWIIPTRETVSDGSATPRTDDMALLLSRLNEVWFPKDPVRYEKPLQKGNPWKPLAEVFKRLGVHGMRVGGEYAIARLADGMPTVDSEGNMNLISGCVAGARRNLLPLFDIKVLGNACFPANTALGPAKGSLMESARISKSLYKTLPREIVDSVRAVCGNSFWSLIALQETYRIMDTEKLGIPSQRRSEMESCIKSLGTSPRTNINNIVVKSLILSRDVTDMRRRVGGITESLKHLVRIKDAAPSFAVDPATARMVDDSASLEDLNGVLRIADRRLDDVTGVFGEVMPHVGAVVGRLLSPARTDENSFYDEVGRFSRLFRSLEHPEVAIPKEHKKETILSLINYIEETRAWTREGVISGTTLCVEAGGDLVPLAVMMRTKPVTRPEHGRNPRFLWFSASEAELTGGNTLLRALGFENPLSLTGNVVSVTPTSRESENVIAVGSKLGGPHLLKRLSAGHDVNKPIGQSIGHSLWMFETRTIVMENMDVMQGHSTDQTPLREHLNGVCPDTLIIKGFETWVFEPSKTRPLESKSLQMEHLYKTLNDYTELVAPGGRVLVSSSDPNVRQYFRENPDFLEMETPPNVALVQKDYPRGGIPNIKVNVRSTGNNHLGPVELTEAEDFGVSEIVLIPKGEFVLFQRKGDMPELKNIVDLANQSVLSSRGTPSYLDQLREASARTRRDSILHCSRAAGPGGGQQTPTLYVLEEEMKTDYMFEALLNRTVSKMKDETVDRTKVRLGLLTHIVDAYQREGADAIVERGTARHPKLWVRYRNLSERQSDSDKYKPLPRLRWREREDLKHQLAVQSLIEELYHGGDMPPSRPSWRHDINPPTTAAGRESKKEPVELSAGTNTLDDLRKKIYRDLGIDD